MRALLRKFIARCFHFTVILIDTQKRLFGLLCLNFAPNLHYWTLNHQHAYSECELNKISQLYRPVLMMTINYRYVAVRSNWASVIQQCVPLKIQLVQELKPNDLLQRRISEKLAEDPLFYRKIVFSDEAHFWLNGYSWCKNWSRRIYCNVEFAESWPKIHFFIVRLCSATKLIFGSMGT